MEYWTSPEVVTRFRWRVRVYRVALAIAWCGVLLGVLAALSGKTRALVGAVLIGPAFVMLLIVGVVWRCSNCNGRLNPRVSTPSAGARCNECGAVLYEPDGRYDAPSQPRKPVSPADERSDVDTLAEAEVYLAYDRKAQAIEVLQAALQDNPARADIAYKLAGLRGQPAGKR